MSVGTIGELHGQRLRVESSRAARLRRRAYRGSCFSARSGKSGSLAPTGAGVNRRTPSTAFYFVFNSSTRAVAKGMTASSNTGVRAASFATYSVKDASFISTPPSNTRIPIFDTV